VRRVSENRVLLFLLEAWREVCESSPWSVVECRIPKTRQKLNISLPCPCCSNASAKNGVPTPEYAHRDSRLKFNFKPKLNMPDNINRDPRSNDPPWPLSLSNPCRLQPRPPSPVPSPLALTPTTPPETPLPSTPQASSSTYPLQRSIYPPQTSPRRRSTSPPRVRTTLCVFSLSSSSSSVYFYSSWRFSRGSSRARYAVEPEQVSKRAGRHQEKPLRLSEAI